MPRRPSRHVPTVILRGGHDSAPGHWQSWLAEQLRAADREVHCPDLPAAEPVLADWLAALRHSLRGLPEGGYDLVAHGLGTLVWLHHVAEPGDSPRPARVALVAPPSPAAGVPAGFFPVPLDVDAVRHGAGGGTPADLGVAGGGGTVLIGGEDDPYLPEGIAVAYGRPLKMATTIVAAGAHLDESSGFGEWPAVLDWCGRDNLAFY